MKVCAAFASAAILAWSVAQAAAGPVVDAAQRAETLLAQGKHIEALAALDEAVDAAWEASPLAFRKAMLVDESSGFARYSQRADNDVRADERITVYSEPVGFTYRQQGDLYIADLAVDLTIENSTGQIFVDVKDIFAVRTETRDKQRQFFLGMSHVIPYIRPGEYISTYTVRDKNSAKTGSFRIPMTVVADAPAPAANAPAQTPAPEAAPAADAATPADGTTVPSDGAAAPAPASTPSGASSGQGG